MTKKKIELSEMSYEKSIEELEEILAKLESEQLALEEALALYERGQALGQHCARLLDQAELRVRQLSGDKE